MEAEIFVTFSFETFLAFRFLLPHCDIRNERNMSRVITGSKVLKHPAMLGTKIMPAQRVPKPDKNYKELMAEVLERSKGQRLTFDEIMEALKDNHPYFGQMSGKDWAKCRQAMKGHLVDKKVFVKLTEVDDNGDILWGLAGVNILPQIQELANDAFCPYQEVLLFCCKYKRTGV